MKRIQSVDFIRVMAILAVIAIHTGPFEFKTIPRGTELDLGTVINQLSRFAVPFFFVISGFFWASKFDTPEAALALSSRMAKRIVFIFIAWSAIYILPTDIFEAAQNGPNGLLKVIYWNAYLLVKSPVTAIFQGTKAHLWFLVSLWFCLSISAALVARKMTISLVVLSFILYLIGLAGKSYSDTSIGFHANFNFRNGPFFGLIFFVTGYLLQRQGPKPSWMYWGVAFMIFGFGLHFTELLLLRKYWGIAMAHDFVFGTYFAGVGAALVGLSDPPLLRMKATGLVGPLVLGIYAIHFVFVDLLQPFSEVVPGSLAWEIGYPVLVFTFSAFTAHFMSRGRYTKALVI